MSRKEIEIKFDEIANLLRSKKFIDTPVKRYSSGMYVRLAFAVAAHLEPEILVIDEVLAVGDMAFQKKCLGKMGEVAKKEELFSLSAITWVQSLACVRQACCGAGAIGIWGDISETIARYTQSAASSNAEVSFAPDKRKKLQFARPSCSTVPDPSSEIDSSRPLHC